MATGKRNESHVYLLYGADRLVTATFGQWPISLGGKKILFLGVFLREFLRRQEAWCLESQARIRGIPKLFIQFG